MAEPFKIVFILYPGITQLDFTGPFEVLSRLPDAEVVVASKDGGVLASETGLHFSDLARLADIARCDMICIPGGPGQTAAMQDADFMAEVKRLGEGASYLTSVCTGSLILAAAGLLAGKRAACHWAYRDLLTLFRAIPDAGRVVRDGNIITGGGVTAGIDFALTVAAELRGAEVAQTIQLMLEYAPAPPFECGRPEIAPPELVDRVKRRFAVFMESREAAMREMANA
ncbi:MAG TPA: DJ-1/PfpI family protein [Caulobacterales bacterium]|nr:DJ-1/PfpI family protein [Caulobacterales bacterium]